MPLADEFTAIDVLWIALSVFLVLVAITLAYVLVRLGDAARRLSSLIKGLETELLPLLAKAGGTLDHLNLHLDKAHQMTDSAVGAVDAVDRVVRTVARVAREPVQVVSGVFEGIVHGFADFRTTRDVRGAYETGREAASRRMRDVAEEFDSEDGSSPA